MAGGWRNVAFLGRIWLVTDCCGLVCAFITWMLGEFDQFNDDITFIIFFIRLVGYAEFAFLALFFLSNDLTLSLTIDTLIFNGCAALALMSHYRAMTTGEFESPSSRCLFSTLFQTRACATKSS